MARLLLPLSEAVRRFTAAPCDYFFKDHIKASALLDIFFIVSSITTRKVLFLYLIFRYYCKYYLSSNSFLCYLLYFI